MDMEYLEADASKRITENIWTQLNEYTQHKHVGIVVPCSNNSAVKIYKSYMTGSLIKLFDKENKISLFAQLAERIQENHLGDLIHLLPIATHLEGRKPVPPEAIERDLANIRDHLYSDWKIIIFRVADDDLHFFQKQRLVLYEENLVYTQYNNNLQNLLQTTSTQGNYIEWMLGQLNFPDSEINIEQNIKIPIKQVPLSVFHYLSKFFNENFVGGKNMEHHLIEFSPSYNVRIHAPDENALDFIATQLAEFSCKKYTELYNNIKDRVSMSNKKRLLASIIYNQAFPLFTKIKVPLSTMEHYYRFQFVGVQYGLSFKSSTVLEKWDKCRAKNRDRYIDFRLIDGNFILYNGRELSYKEFEEGRHYLSTFMQRRNDASSIFRARHENIEIEEQNILDPLNKIHMAFKQIAVARNVPNPLYFNYPITNLLGIIREAPKLFNLACCANFIETCHFEVTQPVSDSILDLLDHYYISLTYSIYNQFRSIDFGLDREGAIVSLSSFVEGKLRPFLNSVFLAGFTGDNETAVFTIWFFNELALLSYFKGNFLLFEEITEILTNRQDCLPLLTIQENSVLKEFLLQMREHKGYPHLYDEANKIKAQQRYLTQYNMLSFPHPSLLSQIDVQIQSRKISAHHYELFDNLQEKIAKFQLPEVRELDKELIAQIMTFSEKAKSAPASQIVVTGKTMDLLHCLDEVSICKVFLRIFEHDFNKNDGRCWQEFYRLNLLRDSSEVMKLVNKLLPSNNFTAFYRLLSLNFVPSYLIDSNLLNYVESLNLSIEMEHQVKALLKYFLL